MHWLVMLAIWIRAQRRRARRAASIEADRVVASPGAFWCADAVVVALVVVSFLWQLARAVLHSAWGRAALRLRPGHAVEGGRFDL